MTKIIPKICTSCNEIFSPRHQKINYCSKVCGWIANSIFRKIQKNSGQFKKGLIPWNAGRKTGIIPWNKGLTCETNVTLKLAIEKSSKSKKGKKRGPLSEEIKRKLSEGRKGELNWAKRPEVREKIKQSVLKMYVERPEILENRKSSGFNQYNNGFSSIEEKIKQVLIENKIDFRHNARIGPYYADFLIFDRVVIECDGKYWHSKLGMKEKDRKRDSYMHNKGYFIFRLSEDRILKNANECIQNVLCIYEPFKNTVV